jgi:hypothetical protein
MTNLWRAEPNLRLVEARSRVRDLLRAAGLEARVGYFGRHLSLDQLLSEFEQSGTANPEA